MRYFAFNEKKRVGWFVEGLPWILFGSQIFFSFLGKSCIEKQCTFNVRPACSRNMQK